jgi:tetratricopeptide (TPR) repeat protein
MTGTSAPPPDAGPDLPLTPARVDLRGALGVQVGSGDQHNHFYPPAPVVPSHRAVSNLPPRNPAFTGRGELLEELADRLAGAPVAVVAVRGLGGVGKSQVALEYAHRGLAESRYRPVWWVRAETTLTLAEDLATLAPALGLPAGQDQEETVAAVSAALTERAGWLLVLDNAPNAAAVRGRLPGGSGHVLITSRDRGWGGVATAVDVGQFTRVESLDYMHRRLGQADPDAERLAEAVGDLPLALAQAAGYLDVHGGLSVRRYLEIYADRQAAGRLLAEGIDGYPLSVATTWLIHFTDLADRHPAGLQLLRLCAHLDPDDINLGLLLSQPRLLADLVTAELADAAADPAGQEEVIGALTRTGLLTRLDDDRVRIHRLVAQVTLRHLATHTEAAGDSVSGSDPPAVRWVRHAVTVVAGLFPDEPWEPASWPTCGQLAAHAITVVDHPTAPADAAGRVLGNLGVYLYQRAEYRQALATQQRALAIKEAAYGPDHLEVARTLTRLGNVQQQLGEFPAARDTQQRALAIKEAAYGPDHPEVAVTLGNLGIVQHMLGESPAARASLEHVLAIYEAVYGSEHPEVAVTLGNLGNIQQELGEFPAARASQERALAIKLAVYGSEHPEVARTLTNLGIVQHMLGESPAARASLERALAIKEAVYGSEHPEVAITLTNLGDVQQVLGDWPAARASQERALAIFEAAYGPNHPGTARARRLLKSS